ncbi:hypothetical protein AABM34_23750 [Lysinibacillus fusiformis]
MERTEQKLKKGMKADHNMVYPDFEQMWSSIEQDELKITEGETIEKQYPQKKEIRFGGWTSCRANDYASLCSPEL